MARKLSVEYTWNSTNGRVMSRVSGGMKVGESWRFEIPFSSAAFSSSPSHYVVSSDFVFFRFFFFRFLPDRVSLS